MAQLVEHHLAKVRVAGSSPVFRSISLPRIAALLALALSIGLLGCGPTGERVPLLITDLNVADEGCYLLGSEIRLVADAERGTAVRDVSSTTGSSAISWPPGYTGWRVGSEVEVRDPNGGLVAVTGRTYFLSLAIQVPSESDVDVRTGEGPGMRPAPGVATASCLRETNVQAPTAATGWVLFALVIAGIVVGAILVLSRRRAAEEESGLRRRRATQIGAGSKSQS